MTDHVFKFSVLALLFLILAFVNGHVVMTVICASLAAISAIGALYKEVR